jgi:small GTP-binding protein
MIKRKICLLGAPGVGKTSLVARFVKGIFSEKYQATVGAKVDKKTVQVGGEDVQLVIWDIAGDSAERLSHSPYLRGSAGHLVVADGTQPESLEEAQRMAHEVVANHGPIPLVFLVNKNDLSNLWRVSAAEIERLGADHGKPFVTSAKSGEGVEQAFVTLAEKMAAADSSTKGV